MLLKNKSAIIYGAGGAVGSTIARAYAKQGARLFLTGRTLDRVDALAKEIVNGGGAAEATQVDALDEQAIERHASDVVKKAGQNAGTLLENGVALMGDGSGDRIQFTFDAVNQIKPDMIREATANARTAAEKFAQDSHCKVGSIRRADQGVLEIEDRDAASPEWKTLRVVTTVDFFLE